MNALVKSPETSISERLHAIHGLEERISSWWSQVPDPLQLTRSSIASVPQDKLPNILLLNIAYHQSICALHASIVPLFSWSSEQATWPSARQISAQKAYEHACVVSSLFDATLATFDRVSAIPSFVGYAAYCGCAIQIPFMWAAEPGVRQRACDGVKANLRIIHILSKYWKFTSILVRILLGLGEGYRTNSSCLCDREFTFDTCTKYIPSRASFLKMSPS